MQFKKFKELLEQNLSAYNYFCESALTYQQEKNNKRKPKSRWSEERIEREVIKMWDNVAQNIYDTVSENVKKNTLNPEKTWFEFIAENNLYEKLDQSIFDMKFE